MSNNQCHYHHPQQFIKTQSESGTEDLHYAAFFENTPEEFKRYAEQELHETEEKKAEGIKMLREFATKENATCLDDNNLIVIMRSCKYDTKKYESKFKHFLKVRRQAIEHLKNMDWKVINAVIDDIAIGILPYRDKYGRVIIFSRPNLHFDMYSIEELKTCCECQLRLLLTFPMTSVCGLTYIGESKYHSQFQLFCILKKGLHPFMSIFLNFPIRYRKIHVLNESRFIRWFCNILTPLLPQKLMKRISFHGENLGGLHKHLHPDLLPSDFGGNLGPINNVFYKEKLLKLIQKLRTEDH